MNVLRNLEKLNIENYKGIGTRCALDAPLGLLEKIILGDNPHPKYVGRIVKEVEGCGRDENGNPSQVIFSTPHGTIIQVGIANLFELDKELSDYLDELEISNEEMSYFNDKF